MPRDFDEMTVDAVVENIEKVTDMVNALLEEYDCPPKIQIQIDVAIDELFGNIVNYAYGSGSGSATVRAEIKKEPLTLVMTFIDSGVPYDPLSKEDPDVTLSAEEREVGGLGIFIVRKTMDSMSYSYEDGHNILTVEKKLV